MQITKHTVASIEYRLTDETGEVLDTSEGHGPLSYVHGTDSLVPGLEAELEGKVAGDRLKVRVRPELAYGERDESLVRSVPRSELPAGEIHVGMQFHARDEDGIHVLTVVSVDAEAVRLDPNHPLAGLTLNFDVHVVSVRAATSEELAHGHVHGPGGHAH